MIEEVAKALGPGLCARTAFVGGATTGLLVTDDFAREGVRFTDDVDLIIDIVSYGEWARFQEELRQRGFQVSPEDDVICRMRLGKLKVDFMPDDEAILGFSNRWYELGLKTATVYKLKEDLAVRILTPPLFTATKLEAYLGRGEGDLLMSRDIEDILLVIDGREALLPEIAAAPLEVRRYIAEQFEALTKDAQFENAVAGNLRGDAGRIDLAFRRIAAAIEIGRHD
jgi:predicted nucleotidyltransferase